MIGLSIKTLWLKNLIGLKPVHWNVKFFWAYHVLVFGCQKGANVSCMWMSNVDSSVICGYITSINTNYFYYISYDNRVKFGD